MKKLFIILLSLSILSSPAHGMWSAWTTRLANATHFARKQMTALVKSAPNIMQASTRAIQKPIVQATQNASKQSSMWDRLSKSFASAWNSIKQNFKLPQWLTSPAAKEQIKKSLKKQVQKLGARTPMVGSMAIAGMQAAQAQGKRQEVPAFTAANIKKYHWDATYRAAFIAHAVQKITAKDKETIEAVATILEQYSESHVPITQAALAAFNDVQPMVLKEVLAHNAWAKDEFVKKLITQDNPHLDELFKNYIMWGKSERFYNLLERRWVTVTRNPAYDWAIGNGDGAQIGITQAILTSVIENPALASVQAYNIIFNRISSKQSALCIMLHQNLRKAAIKHYGQDAATMIRLAKGTLKKSDITSKPLCIYNYEAGSYDFMREFTGIVIHEIATLSVQDIESAYRYAARYNYSWWNYPAYGIKQAAQRRFGTCCDIATHSLQELVYIYSYSYSQIEFSAPTTLKYPAFLCSAYYFELEKKIRNLALAHDLSSIPTDYLSYIYDYILENDREKKEFTDKIRPLFKEMPPLYGTHILNAAMQGYDQGAPSFLIQCTKYNHQATQSEKHFCANIRAVMQHMFQKHAIKQKTNAISLFKRALSKERQEIAKGNHVFYHGRKWEYDFWADLDKMTYNLKNPDKPLTDIRLRFDDTEGALCLNYALFANATRKPSNTASYVVNNHDFSTAGTSFNLHWPFKRFGLENHFNRYKKEFEKLKEMHTACNKHGSLLMLSIPDKNLNDIVYSAQEGSMGDTQQARVVNGSRTTDMHTIINALKTDPATIQNGNSDYIEFALRITPQLKDKIRIYPMSQADPIKYKEYTDYRDQLFARIKTDIEKTKGKKS